MEKVFKLEEVRIDGGTQSREELDHAQVKHYADLMKMGVEFKPPVVFFDGSHNWLADGFHRYFAHKSNGALEITCTVMEGTVDDAMFYGISANGPHGMRPKPGDIRKGIFWVLNHPVHGQMSNNAIAKHMHISPLTVAKYRAEWEEQTGAEPLDEVTFVKDGKTKTMKVKNIGKKREKKEKPVDPAAPPEMTELEKVSQKLLEIENRCMETINENEKLRDAIAVGQYDASDIEKIDVEETLADLREQIRIKDIEIASLRESRDTYQNRAAELMKQVKVLQAKLKKAGIE